MSLMYCSTANQRAEQQGMATAHMDTSAALCWISPAPDNNINNNNNNNNNMDSLGKDSQAVGLKMKPN